MKLFIILPLVLTLFFFVPQISYEHQDGCHMWHSCPSDSDSYICGDLGYDNDCPIKNIAKTTDFSLTVQTDKNTYTENEPINISINTETVRSAVSIVMENMDGDFIQMAQGKLELHSPLTTQFMTGGSLMKDPGTYTITVTAVNNITNFASFEYAPSLKIQIENQVSLEKITCFNDLELMLKNNGDLVCVTHSTMIKLLERNWGSYAVQ